ncbi:hypothetical protein DVH05_005866 [Phytophthora capsici]|nr:hypothetical protein DVH05_005866 [Phytophthora capsici]
MEISHSRILVPDEEQKGEEETPVASPIVDCRRKTSDGQDTQVQDTQDYGEDSNSEDGDDFEVIIQPLQTTLQQPELILNGISVPPGFDFNGTRDKDFKISGIYRLLKSKLFCGDESKSRDRGEKD